MTMPFDPSRVAVVDRVGSNILARGMDPACGGKLFNTAALLSAVENAGADPTGHKLVVIYVIDNVGERWAWSPEVRAFGFDPDDCPASQWPPYLNRPGWDPSKPFATNDLGDLYWWPFEGLPENTDPTVFLTSPGWDFSGLVQKVVDLTLSERDALIYFHCMLGADRTGALHTGYLMNAKGYGLSKAAEIADKSTSARAPNADYARLRAAYAQSHQLKSLGR